VEHLLRALALVAGSSSPPASRWRGPRTALARKPAEWFVFVFRGSPLFIQFFFGYFLFLTLKQQYPVLGILTSAWLGR
jgi:polar amino acid transport system permease protein